MMLAAERLAEGRYPLAEAARSLGYGSENAFNTAFRRVMGVPPRRYARQRAPGREDGWGGSALSHDAPGGSASA